MRTCLSTSQRSQQSTCSYAGVFPSGVHFVVYKGEGFESGPTEVIEDLKWARAHYRYIEKIFLADGPGLAQ